MAKPTQEQMEMAFMQDDAVLADDGMNKDPVSGNDIPSGSMAEEVRDDVPAMLSEGEYVVPADVVRFHGIQKFEELRDEAKMGLARMEQDGRIGGAPVEDQDELPFSLEELETTTAYRGGLMGFAEGGDTGSFEDAFGQSYTANQRYGSVGSGSSQLGFQLRNFTSSKTGKTITIPFYNGKPMQYIPPEYGASDTAGSGGGGATDTAADERDRQADEAERARINVDRGMSDRAYDAAQKAISGQKETPTSFADFTTEDWQRYNSQQRSILAAGTRKLPLLGFFQGLNEKAARAFAVQATTTGKNPETGEALTKEEMDALNKVATTPLNKSLLESLQTVIDQQQPDFLTYEQDRTISADPNVPTSAVTEGTTATTTADVQGGGDFFGEQQLGELGSRPEDGEVRDTQTVSQKAKSILTSSVDATDGNVNDFGVAYAQSPQLWQKVSQTAFNAAKLEFLMAEVGMTDTQGNSLGNTYGTIVNNLEKSYNINYNPDTKLFMPQNIKTQGGGKEDRLTVGVGHLLPPNADPNKGYTKNEVLNFLNEDLTKARGEAEKVVQEYGGNLNLLDVGPQVLLTQIAAQSGGGKWSKIKDVLDGKIDKSKLGGLAGFQDAVTAAISGDWDTFGKEIMNSKLGKTQATNRYSYLTEKYLNTESPINVVQTQVKENPSVVKQVSREKGETDTDILRRAAKQIPAGTDVGGAADPYSPATEGYTGQTMRDATAGIDLGNVDPVPPRSSPPRPLDPINILGGPLSDTTTGEPTQQTRPQSLGVPFTQPEKFKLFDTSRFTDSLSRAAEFLGLKDPVSRPLPKQTLDNLPSGFNFNKTQLSDVPKKAPKSLAQQTSELMTRTAPDQIAFESRPLTPETPTSITAGGAKGSIPQVGGPDLSRLYGRGFKPEDIGTQPKEDFIFDYGYGTAGSPKPKAKAKPAEETLSQKDYEKRVKDSRTEEYAKARKDADTARDNVLKQGGSVQEAFDAAQTAFTGFTPSGEMVDPNMSDPFSDIPNFGAFKEGGLASKPKKTKSKKRNVKKGLGGKMAT